MHIVCFSLTLQFFVCFHDCLPLFLNNYCSHKNFVFESSSRHSDCTPTAADALRSISHNLSIAPAIIMPTNRDGRLDFKPSKWEPISFKFGVMSKTLDAVSCIVTWIAKIDDIDERTGKPFCDTENGVVTLERLSGTQLVRVLVHCHKGGCIPQQFSLPTTTNFSVRMDLKTGKKSKAMAITLDVGRHMAIEGCEMIIFTVPYDGDKCGFAELLFKAFDDARERVALSIDYFNRQAIKKQKAAKKAEDRKRESYMSVDSA